MTVTANTRSHGFLPEPEVGLSGLRVTPASSVTVRGGLDVAAHHWLPVQPVNTPHPDASPPSEDR
jgi:hypothetical protein